jgi:dienelactone hydrolase
MSNRISAFLLALSALLALKNPAMAQNNKFTGKEITYRDAGGKVLKGYVAYNKKAEHPLPSVLVIPEWWGCNEYARKRADMLAGLGYFAIAVDMYGEGIIVETPQEASALAGPFYKDPGLGKMRMEAAIQELKKYPQADTGRIAAIGYCFGGSMVLNGAKLGLPLKGVVSFHGGLAGVMAEPGVLKARILVCHGGADPLVSAADVKSFRENLDAVKADYLFIAYPGATHAFTNPNSTAVGKKYQMPIAYQEEADKKSWEAMKKFLAETL